jgi:hypothetical protein
MDLVQPPLLGAEAALGAGDAPIQVVCGARHYRFKEVDPAFGR